MACKRRRGGGGGGEVIFYLVSFYFVAFSAFELRLPINTAPTIAAKNSTDEISKGTTKSVNNFCPKFFTKPRLGSCCVGNCSCSEPRNAPNKVTTKRPLVMTAMV